MEQYTVTGMSCAACSARVEKAVSKVEGVTSCSVSLLTNSMGVEGAAAPEAVIAAVEQAGYGASKRERGGAGRGNAGVNLCGRRYVERSRDANIATAIVLVAGVFGSFDVFFHGAYDVELAGSGISSGESSGDGTFAIASHSDCDDYQSEVFC